MAGSSGSSRPLVSSADVVDVFVYVVVLNLAVEYFPLIITETFTLSLLTALLLKGVLEGVIWVKDRAKARLKAATSVSGKVLGAVALWAVLIVSKFVVLELVALVFGSQVQLGGFFAVNGLVISLLLARSGVRWLLGRADGAGTGQAGS